MEHERNQGENSLNCMKRYILTMWNSYAVPEKKIRIQRFISAAIGSCFFHCKIYKSFRIFYCIVSKIWYSKYDNQSVCVDTYKITEKGDMMEEKQRPHPDAKTGLTSQQVASQKRKGTKK